MAHRASRAIMDRGIYILGVGNMGKYVGYALMNSRNQQMMRSHLHGLFPAVTLMFHRPGLFADWETAGGRISYTTDLALEHQLTTDELSQSSKVGARRFRIELTGTAAAANQETKSKPAIIKHLIVATKTHATTAALAPLKHRLSKDSHVMFLQNGMGVTDEVSSELFPDPATRPTYWAAICNAGVYSPSPFHIVHAGRGHLKFGVVGPRPTDEYDPDPRKTQLENPMVSQLLSTRMLEPYLLSPERTVQAQLLKLVINSVINPLTAVFNCKNGALRGDSYEAIMRLLVKEAGAIVRALLPDMPEKDVYTDALLNHAVVEVAKLTAQNTSSMLQDVQIGRPTEIDYINGYFVAQGKKLGLPYRYHAEMVERVKSLEGRPPPLI